jgi:hypothetical protein
LTLTVLWVVKSCTETVPRRLLVSVPSQRFWVSQIVPRIVAALWLPTVCTRARPLPQTWPRTDRPWTC